MINPGKMKRLKSQVSSEVSRYERILTGHEAMSKSLSIYGATNIRDAKTSEEYKRAKATIGAYNWNNIFSKMVYTPRPSNQMALEIVGAREISKAQERMGKRSQDRSRRLNTAMNMSMHQAIAFNNQHMQDVATAIQMNQDMMNQHMSNVNMHTHMMTIGMF